MGRCNEFSGGILGLVFLEVHEGNGRRRARRRPDGLPRGGRRLGAQKVGRLNGGRHSRKAQPMDYWVPECFRLVCPMRLTEIDVTEWRGTPGYLVSRITSPLRLLGETFLQVADIEGWTDGGRETDESGLTIQVVEKGFPRTCRCCDRELVEYRLLRQRRIDQFEDWLSCDEVGFSRSGTITLRRFLLFADWNER